MAKKETSQKKQSEDTLKIINLSVNGLRKVSACSLYIKQKCTQNVLLQRLLIIGLNTFIPGLTKRYLRTNQ